MARRSRATDRFRREVNAKYPTRPRVSDGWIGDAAHLGRRSDHNPNEADVVQAEDVTLTDAQGEWSFNYLRKLQDPRTKYVIYNRQMFSSYPAHGYKRWAIRSYSGVNAHLNHLHLSVQNTPNRYDDSSTWGIATVTSMPTEDDIMEELITNLQRALVDAGYNLGKWGPKKNGVDGAWGEDTQDGLTQALKDAKNTYTRGISQGEADTRYVRKNINVRIR